MRGTESPLPYVSEEWNLQKIVDEGREFALYPDAAYAWSRMKDAARGDGVRIWIVSAFRSVTQQEAIIEKKRLMGIPEGEIFLFCAPPGFSEHHSGRAIDLCTDGVDPVTEEIERTKAFRWLSCNAKTFGFRMTYPKDNEYDIGYEPWHWYYTGEHNQSGEGTARSRAE